MTKIKPNTPVQFLNTNNVNTVFNGGAPGVNDLGSAVFNTLTNSFSVYNGTTWDGIKEYVTGRVITVDTASPNATDTRTGLSNYSKTYPFKTIQAAVNAMVLDGTGTGYIYIMSGYYNEEVTINVTMNFDLYYDNVFHQGGTNPALKLLANNVNVRLILNNSYISNTGNAADRINSAAVVIAATKISVQGFGVGANSYLGGDLKGKSTITSVEGHAIYIAPVSADITIIDNMHLISTNGYGFYQATGSQISILNNSYFESTNFSAVFYSRFMRIYRCYLIASANAIDASTGNLGDGGIELFDTQIKSTNGGGFTGGGALGAGGGVINIKNCKFDIYNEAWNFGSGNSSIDYTFNMSDCIINIGNTSVTSALMFPNTVNTTSKIILAFIKSNIKFVGPTIYSGVTNLTFCEFANKYTITHDETISLGGDFYYDANQEKVFIGAAGTSGQAMMELKNSSASNDYLRLWNGTSDVLHIDNSGNINGATLNIIKGTVQTTNATATTIITYTLSDNTDYDLYVTTVSRDIAGTERSTLRRQGLFYRQGGGGATQQGATQTPVTDIHTNVGMNVTFATSGNDVLIQVTGVAATTINWKAILEVVQVS